MTAPPGTEGLTPQQIQAIQAAQSGAGPAGPSAPARNASKRSVGSRIARVVMASVLVAGLGAGARAGWKYYQDRQASGEDSAQTVDAGYLPAIGTGLPTVEMDRPTGQYVDVTVVVESAELTSETNVRRDLTSDRLTRTESGVENGEPYTLMMDVRDEQVVARTAADAPWADVTDDALFNDLVAESGAIATGAIMFSDLLPAHAHPFTMVIVETDEQLPVVPLQTADTADTDGADDVDAASEDVRSTLDDGVPQTPGVVVRPVGPTPVRHYQFQTDVSAYAEQLPFDYIDSFVTPRADTMMDVWVDELGIVRQVSTVAASGATITITFNDIAPALPNFQDVGIVAMPQPDEGS